MKDLTAAAFLPETKTLSSLREASKICRGCPLYKNATQTVFGEGSKHSEIVFVGALPGEKEDREGLPFVGPAGKLLNEALMQAGIDRQKTYVTNAVKHFKFVRQGRYRLHRNPGGREMKACRPWLDEELKLLRPKVVVALGAIAGRALLGRALVLRKDRGFHDAAGNYPVFLTTHPSALLRMRAFNGDYGAEYKHFVEDLRQVKQKLNLKIKRAA